MLNYKLILISFIFLIIFILLIYGFFIEPYMLKVTQYKIKAPELSGIKIAFASDFHILPFQKNRLDKIVQIINYENPDIVLSVGDFVAGHTKKASMPIEDIAFSLSRIKAPCGFFTVLGNHDILYGKDEVVKALEKNGINVLENSNEKIMIKNKSVYIAGVDDYKFGTPDIEKALSNTKTPVIFLTHSPDIFPDINQKVNLVLAGHTHGGQVRLPFIGAILTASKYRNKYVIGLIEENGKKLITTTGLGTSLLPVRFGCKPEIVIVTFE